MLAASSDILGIIFTLFAPESPRYLALKGKMNKAE